jgi:toxin ParE1/3/4
LPRVRLTQQAETDLDEIWLHVAQENPVAADGVIDAIVDHATIIATQPLSGRARPELGENLMA